MSAGLGGVKRNSHQMTGQRQMPASAQGVMKVMACEKQHDQALPRIGDAALLAADRGMERMQQASAAAHRCDGP